MLVRTDVFDQIGLMDEKLPCLHEERDFCLTVSGAGGEIYIEPKAVVTYVPPPPCESWDLPYFMLRWSEAWIHSSVRHFNQKWGLASVRHISDISNNFAEGTVIGFGRAWRRRVAGTKVTFDSASHHGIRPLDQARLMIALLQSVDREQFDFARIYGGRRDCANRIRTVARRASQAAIAALNGRGCASSWRRYSSRSPVTHKTRRIWSHWTVSRLKTCRESGNALS